MRFLRNNFIYLLFFAIVIIIIYIFVNLKEREKLDYYRNSLDNLYYNYVKIKYLLNDYTILIEDEQINRMYSDMKTIVINLKAKNQNQSISKLNNEIEKMNTIIEENKILRSNISDLIIYISENINFAINKGYLLNIYSKVFLSKIEGFQNYYNLDFDIENVLRKMEDHRSIDFILVSNIKNLNQKQYLLEENYRKFIDLNFEDTYEQLIKINTNELINLNKNIFVILFLCFTIMVIFLYKIIMLHLKHDTREQNEKINLNFQHFSKVCYCHMDLNLNIIKANKLFIKKFCKEGLVKSKIVIDKDKIKDGDFAVYDLKGSKISFFDFEDKSKEYDKVIFIKNDGSFMYVRMLVVKKTSSASNIIKNILVYIFDITDQEVLNFKLLNQGYKESSMLFIDSITELNNSLFLTDLINKNKKGFIVLISIKNFDNILFFYGIKETNNIIVKIAKSLENYTKNFSEYRKELCYLDNCEFCIFFYSNEIQNIVESLLIYITDKDLLQFSLGVSSLEDTSNFNRLQQAKLAFNEAISKDRKYVYYTNMKSGEEEFSNRQFISKMISEAIKNSGITVVCQPIYKIEKGKEPVIYSYEILVRLIDKQGVMHYPGEFLQISKKAFLYFEITKIVIEKAFNLLGTYGHRHFSINLSSSDMLNTNIRDFIERKILLLSNNSNNLIVEFLETDNVEENEQSNYKQIQDFVNFIKSKGCSVAIDDFGSGYSNYYRILELSVDYLKIDGSLVSKILIDKKAESVVKSIISFSNSVGYRIVAEFVSDKNILDKIIELGVEYGQGFYLGKPEKIEYYEHN